MVGRVKCVREKGKGTTAIEHFCGLTVLTATLCIPPEMSAKKLARRLSKLEETFRRAEVSRVMLPKGFPYLESLKFVQPVKVLDFYRGVADLLVLASLRQQKIEPCRSRVALAGPRLCLDMRKAAERLCRQVREIRIDIPGGEGEIFAQKLQQEYGLPMVPESVPADVTAAFGPTGAAADLCLWGEEPCLNDLRLTADGFDLHDDLEQPVLALLWEQGRLERETIQVRKAL